MEPLRLALWQTPHPRDSDEALQRLDTTAGEAAALGAHWLITPEMFLTGYLIDPARLCALAEPADGPLLRAVRDLARRHGLGIVTGWPEASGGARPFNSAVAIDGTGAPLAMHRKIHLFGDGDAQRFMPGGAPPAWFDWRGWRLGLLICFDVEHDEQLRQLAAAGARAALVPTANMVGYDAVQQTRLPEAARRFGLAIAYANACGREGGTAYNGWSCVCTGEGEGLGMAGRGEALLAAALSAPPSTPPARTRA